MLHGAGCIINDYFDKEYDKKVERCKNRPFVKGEVKELPALAFWVFNLTPIAVGCWYSPPVAQIAIASLLPAQVIYPFCKRFTNWPQIMLGLNYSTTCLGTYAMITGTIDPACWALWLGGIAHAVHTDTIYAFQDRDDDLKAGVKSTAVRFGDNYKFWMSGLTAVTAGCWTATGMFAALHPVYYLSLAAATGQMLWQIGVMDTKGKTNLKATHQNSKYVLLTLFAGIVASKLIDKKD
jgi:4-hydroxybenzoate polyprenyl transferase